MSTLKNNHETDVILNRANIALARSQRLVASWLPARTAEELANTKSEEELLREEDEIFKPVPEKYVSSSKLPLILLRIHPLIDTPILKESPSPINQTSRLGLGASPDSRTATPSVNDKLRQQLLGKNYRGNKTTGLQSDKRSSHVPPLRQSKLVASTERGKEKENDEDEDDEQGRSALGRSKKKRKVAPERVQGKNVEERAEGEKNVPLTATREEGGRGEVPSKTKGRGSFLDELLSDRSRKKKKKSQ